MTFARAFNYAFDDRQWTEKLIITAIMSLVAAIPVFGLVALAGLMGWVVELVANMRGGSNNPMPRWDNLGEKIALGANVLTAWVVYNLPNLLLLCCGLSIPLLGDAGRSEFFAGSFAVALVCCLVPLLLVYNLAIWPMLAIGTIRYSEARQIGVFFQFGDLWKTINEQTGVVVQWLAFSLLANFLIGLLAAIPCIGWAASLVLSVPVQAHLLGQFAQQLRETRKSKPKRYSV